MGAQLTVSKDFVFGETNKSPDFLKKFPLGKVPAFEGSDGVLLTESNAIAYYVANEELRGGSDAAARAQVVQWMGMAEVQPGEDPEVSQVRMPSQCYPLPSALNWTSFLGQCHYILLTSFNNKSRGTNDRNRLIWKT